MNNETYKVQEILNNMKKYKNINILIKGETKKFDIIFDQKNVPHLLGLQYINENKKDKTGNELLNHVKSKGFSDQEILQKVEKYYGVLQMIRVENRINSFEDFINNLEKGIIVEKTLEKGEMNVNYLIVQSKNNKFYHLGILSCNIGEMFENFDEIDEKIQNDIIKTYFTQKNIKYFENTKIMEYIENISIYNDSLEDYIPFSFDDNKNNALIEEYKKNKDFNYKEFLKNFENNVVKEQQINWGKKENIENEIER
ncbi:PBECR4 domain-containing protein [Streptobacillus felis]|uniref:PBECR4 domain-containing protein n=1 Tax=Streptobacillus felis TaxID=1384509 RepID=UPI00082A4F0E|nr:PBECR4 domain-containing protein [Streptobacillus felis]